MSDHENILNSEDTEAGKADVVLSDPKFLQELRQQMLRFATLQLSDVHLAEDAVQDALIGALRNANSFAGRAALKTWVFAILKNKIIDILRQRRRRNEVSPVWQDDEGEDFTSDLFDQKGFWQSSERPKAWSDPELAMQDQRFWQVFEVCLDHLPGQQAQVFMMRTFVGLESSEICINLDLSVSNLNVILHRARLRLRSCLEQGWFAGEHSL